MRPGGPPTIRQRPPLEIRDELPQVPEESCCVQPSVEDFTGIRAQIPPVPSVRQAVDPGRRKEEAGTRGRERYVETRDSCRSRAGTRVAQRPAETSSSFESSDLPTGIPASVQMEAREGQ